MATSYTPALRLQKPANSDRFWDLALNANADTLDLLTPLGGLLARANESPSTTLLVAVNGGSYARASGGVVDFAATTIAAPASASGYLWVEDGGALAMGGAWPATPHVRLAIVTAGPSTILEVLDARVAARSAGAPGPHAKEGGPDARAGLATLAGGTASVATTAITAASRVFLAAQTAGGTRGFLAIASVVPGASFAIQSSSSSETSTVAWLIVEPTAG